MASVYKRKDKSDYWYFAWTDHTGRRQTKCSNTTDKAAAKRIAAKYEADAALRRDGVIDPRLESVSGQSQRTIKSHLEDYEAKLKAAKRSGGHISKTLFCIRQIVDFAAFRLACDITADGVNRYAALRREAGDSSRTVQAHLTAIKGFTKWLVETEKLLRDPLASIKRPNPKADRRYERRMLLPAEWHLLCKVLQADRHGMAAAERLLLYETAIQTGLRSAELRSLTRARLYLTGDHPHVVCKAGDTKNEKEARQYVRPELAAALAKHVAGKKPQAAVFNLPADWKMAAMLRDDLSDGRQTWIDEAREDTKEQQKRIESDFLAETNHDGGRLDFHALRHTCGAWLAMSGVHPKVVQTVMRHSTITLTMDTYGHLFPGQEAEAVGKLGLLLGGVTTSSDSAGQRQGQRAGRCLNQSDATQCERDDANGAEGFEHNALPHKDFCELPRRSATGNESRAAQIRTGNQRIMSPLL